MAAISKAWGSVVVLNYLIDLDILDINLNFLVSYSCLLNHCVVKVVVVVSTIEEKKTQGILIKLLDPCWISLTIIVYKRPMFINP